MASEWQDIATAPKGGTWILAIMAGTHVTTGESFLPCVVRWAALDSGEHGWQEPEDADFDLLAEYTPTHWMSLPAPPASDDDEEPDDDPNRTDLYTENGESGA